jgi:hypothetical protein
MLTLIAYRFAIDAQVPKVSYTTKLDEFILISTLTVFVALIQAVISSILAQKNRVTLAENIDRKCRVIFPMVFFVGVFLRLLR